MGKKTKSVDVPLQELSLAQQEIMEIVWRRGEITASEVVQELSLSRDVSRNTVRTLIERMEQKGWLKHREEGRTFVYSSAQAKQTSIDQKICKVVDSLCGGSIETLIASLIDHRGLNKSELDRVRKLIDEATPKRAEKKS